MPSLVKTANDTPLYLYHSHLRWDGAYQRPLHLLSRLARHVPVIVEEEAVFDDRPPGLDALHVGPGVTVLRPHRRPGDDTDLSALVEAHVAAVRGGRPLVRWFSSPMFASYGDRLGSGQVVVYDCMDEPALPKDATDGHTNAEDRLLTRADFVFTGGRGLYDAMVDRNPGVHLFPSTVEADPSWDAVAEAMHRLVAERVGQLEAAPAPRKKARRVEAGSARNLIVGGGPAGLSAALHLEDTDFLLAEKHARTGGLCRSIVQDGFTFDQAGHIFFTTDAYVDGLFRDVLADNYHEQMRESWVYLYDAYQRYPFQGNLFGLPPAVVKECLLGVIEAGRNAPPAPAAAVGNGSGNGAGSGSGHGHGTPPANFLEWSHRTFGAGITRHFMQPYNFKVWGIDPARMSSDWINGRVLTPSLDEVIEGSLQRGRPDMGPNAKFGYPLHGGCEMFVAGLARRAFGRGGACTTGRTLVKVDPKRRRATFRVGEAGGRSARLETVGYGTLYPSIPLPDLIAAVDGAPEAVRQAAASLPSTAVVCVNLGINRAHVTEKHWIYYPEGQDKYIFQRIFVQSNASPHTAPEGCSALTFEISHSKFKPLPVRGKRALIDACVAGLRRTDLWREGDEVIFEQVVGMPHAYIPFTPERPGHLEVINAYLHEQGIHPIGRFGEWKYVNQDGAILSAKRVVESVQAGGSLHKTLAKSSVRTNETARPAATA